MIKPYNRPDGRGKRVPPLVAGATTFAPVGSVSLDFRVATFPYKSSSLATPQAGALWVLSNVPHDTKGERRAVYSAP